MEEQVIAEASRLVEIVLRQKLPGGFHESLRSGVRLCTFYIALFPLRRRPKFRSARPEHYESNILSFLDVVVGLVPDDVVFSVADLMHGEKEGLRRVALTVLALAKASGRRFPPNGLQFQPSYSALPALGPNSRARVPSFQASDTVSVESSSSSTDWFRVEVSSISSPQQALSPLTTRESWVRVSKFEGLDF